MQLWIDTLQQRVARLALSDLLIKVFVRSQLYIAFQVALFSYYFTVQILHVHDLLITVFVFLSSWFVYVLDRLIPSVEDDLSLSQQHRFVIEYRLIFVGLMVASVVGSAILSSIWGWKYFLGYAGGISLSLFYALPIPVIRKRIKDIPFMKIVYVPSVYLATITLMLDQIPWHLYWSQHSILYLSYILLGFVVFDLKDRNEDLQAGVQTIANSFSTRVFLNGLMMISVLLAAFCLILNQSLLMVCCLLFSVGLIPLYSKPFNRIYYFTMIDLFIGLPGLIYLTY